MGTLKNGNISYHTRGKMIRSAKLIGFFYSLMSFFLFTEMVAAQEKHTLRPRPKTVAWGYYAAKAAPVLCIRPELGGRYPAKRAIL